MNVSDEDKTLNVQVMKHENERFSDGDETLNVQVVKHQYECFKLIILP